jgi:hypothetical protein
MPVHSDELKLESINDTLNPEPPRFGLPWYAILGVLVVATVLFLIPHCRVVGLLFCPSALGFGWWLCHKDPKEPVLILHDLALPAEFDPGKE